MKVCDDLVKVPIRIVTWAIHGVTGEVLGEIEHNDFIYEPQKFVSKVSVAAETVVTN